ncbi:MAG: hypothetical protein KIT84_06845 [Labilithrix sp.]|nr:hypothetical protein [Labilithrix sp.]MCW5810711.1 hypothetical protein [Labilithrix sp.]
MAALAKFGYVDLDLEVDHEARTLVPPSMPGEEPRESDRPTMMPASGFGDRPDSYAPSESGVSPKDDRVGAMRELYERGDIEAALALGASLASLFEPENGEEIVREERIGVEDDEEEFSPFAGLRELQAPLSAALAADEEDAET